MQFEEELQVQENSSEIDWRQAEIGILRSESKLGVAKNIKGKRVEKQAKNVTDKVDVWHRNEMERYQKMREANQNTGQQSSQRKQVDERGGHARFIPGKNEQSDEKSESKESGDISKMKKLWMPKPVPLEDANYYLMQQRIELELYNNQQRQLQLIRERSILNKKKPAAEHAKKNEQIKEDSREDDSSYRLDRSEKSKRMLHEQKKDKKEESHMQRENSERERMWHDSQEYDRNDTNVVSHVPLTNHHQEVHLGAGFQPITFSLQGQYVNEDGRSLAEIQTSASRKIETKMSHALKLLEERKSTRKTGQETNKLEGMTSDDLNIEPHIEEFKHQFNELRKQVKQVKIERQKSRSNTTPQERKNEPAADDFEENNGKSKSKKKWWKNRADTKGQSKIAEEPLKYAGKMTERRKFWEVNSSSKDFYDQPIEEKAKITAIGKFKRGLEHSDTIEVKQSQEGEQSSFLQKRVSKEKDEAKQWSQINQMEQRLQQEILQVHMDSMEQVRQVEVRNSITVAIDGSFSSDKIRIATASSVLTTKTTKSKKSTKSTISRSTPSILARSNGSKQPLGASQLSQINPISELDNEEDLENSLANLQGYLNEKKSNVDKLQKEMSDALKPKHPELMQELRKHPQYLEHNPFSVDLFNPDKEYLENENSRLLMISSSNLTRQLSVHTSKSKLSQNKLKKLKENRGDQSSILTNSMSRILPPSIINQPVAQTSFSKVPNKLPLIGKPEKARAVEQNPSRLYSSKYSEDSNFLPPQFERQRNKIVQKVDSQGQIDVNRSSRFNKISSEDNRGRQKFDNYADQQYNVLDRQHNGPHSIENETIESSVKEITEEATNVSVKIKGTARKKKPSESGRKEEYINPIVVETDKEDLKHWWQQIKQSAPSLQDENTSQISTLGNANSPVELVTDFKVFKEKKQVQPKKEQIFQEVQDSTEKDVVKTKAVRQKSKEESIDTVKNKRTPLIHSDSPNISRSNQSLHLDVIDKKIVARAEFSQDQIKQTIEASLRRIENMEKEEQLQQKAKIRQASVQLSLESAQEKQTLVQKEYGVSRSLSDISRIDDAMNYSQLSGESVNVFRQGDYAIRQQMKKIYKQTGRLPSRHENQLDRSSLSLLNTSAHSERGTSRQKENQSKGIGAEVGETIDEEEHQGDIILNKNVNIRKLLFVE